MQQQQPKKKKVQDFKEGLDVCGGCDDGESDWAVPALRSSPCRPDTNSAWQGGAREGVRKR